MTLKRRARENVLTRRTKFKTKALFWTKNCSLDFKTKWNHLKWKVNIVEDIAVAAQKILGWRYNFSQMYRLLSKSSHCGIPRRRQKVTPI